MPVLGGSGERRELAQHGEVRLRVKPEIFRNNLYALLARLERNEPRATIPGVKIEREKFLASP